MSILTQIQKVQPLVLNLANQVTTQRVADIISFLGASPLMTKEIQEIESLLTIADALVVNIGTISESDVPIFLKACQLANQMHKPIVLDPVAVNVPYRASVVKQLLSAVSFDIIRGNAAEIAWFADKKAVSKGIDALELVVSPENAKIAAKKTGAVIVQTGKTDVVTDGTEVLFVSTDSPLFKVNVGCGDMLSATIGAFVAVSDNLIQSAYEATKFFGEAGEQATEQVQNLPGGFINAFLDEIYQKAREAK
ncbi:hydroxyethylthiazole kinase [Lactococcus protaetiae]|uniref:Hydroxyethylthiazole kinase n=1 Tax=Lactococcus protaetiae TaxID=2592653 RepID=A0A514Z879_9LACT|nr:hydroxyethylthiazole kinase [Lactococcus protaetiae]QDK70796.1 hydroxyethylthiazole kinase [Lactococcus protaetiae]